MRVIFEDRSRLLWIGTRGDGIAALDLKPAKFRRLLDEPVMSIVERRGGDLFIGTLDGLVKIDGGGTSTRWRHRPGDSSSLAGNIIRG